MPVEEDEEIGIPEWVVTFGDMMSLLLTFFIMLVSMSEIKQNEQFQAIAESIRRRFGHELTVFSPIPGDMKPRNAELMDLGTMGRSKKMDTHKGGDKVRAPVGDNPRVRSIHNTGQQVLGGVIFFEEELSELKEENKRRLQMTAEEIGGKPQKIEIRGHTSRKPIQEGSPYRDNWDLAYARCRETMEFLVEIGIDRSRIRLSVAADTEPHYTGIDPRERMRNARVEVLMLGGRTNDKSETQELGGVK